MNQEKNLIKLQEKDFIEIEFTGKTKEGIVFDSNKEEDLKKLNPSAIAKPFVFALGESMFLKGIDEFLIGKEIGNYKVELKPEDAFGKRDSKLVQVIPMKVFREHNVNPIPRTIMNFDGRMAKILTVSGGRVIADFNNPLAGKEVIYEIKILKKVEDLNEKIKAFIDFLFRQDFKFQVQDKKLILEVEKQFVSFVELFKEKFKEMFDLELEAKIIEKSMQ